MDGFKPTTTLKSTMPGLPQNLHICCSHLAQITDEPALSHSTYREPAVPNRDSWGQSHGSRRTYCAAGTLLWAPGTAGLQHGCHTPTLNAHSRKSAPTSVLSHQIPGCNFPDRLLIPTGSPCREPPPKAKRLQPGTSLPLPMTCTLSFGAGCCGNRWHGLSRSSPDRAGNCGIAGSGSGTPSCSRCGSRNTQRDGRLWERDAKL